VVITNPPYGERLSDRKGCEAVARALRRAQGESRATLSVITAFTGFERAFGRRADKRRRLYNGRLECEFMTFYPDGGKKD
jgi:putative N6-adenine-specific DNA methylase